MISMTKKSPNADQHITKQNHNNNYICLKFYTWWVFFFKVYFLSEIDKLNNNMRHVSFVIHVNAEKIMREALDKCERGISIGGRVLEIMERVRKTSEKGIHINVLKTKVMITRNIEEDM